ncbi:MAG: hypothetical protein JSS27_09110 [Planctomycetes bacterium]|nr:hypothetical protein [Planctomycetota bacterium]
MLYVVACWFLLVGDVVASPQDERFLAGLRERQLYELAERYCQRQLDRSGLSPARRVWFTLEMARSCADQALNSAPEAREQLWQRAIAALDSVAKQNPSPSDVVLTQVQRGLIALSRGRQLRAEAPLSLDSTGVQEQAKLHLRQAIEQLAHAAATVDTLQRQRVGRAATAEDSLGEPQLLALTRNVTYQQSLALMEQGLCYPADSADRLSSMQQAYERLGAIPALDDALDWQVQVARVATLRELNDWTSADRLLAELQRKQPPADVALLLRAERLQLLLAQKQLDAALREADALEQALPAVRPAELDMSILAVYLAAAQADRQANHAPEAERRQQQAAAVARRIEEQQTAYWGRMAEMTLARAVSGAPASADLEQLTRAAESYYRVGKLGEAIATYEVVVQRARETKQTDAMFAATLAAAAIEQQQQQFSQAAQRLHTLALASPENARASAAHLQAIYLMAQQLKPADEAAFKQYLAWLDEHLQRWPRGETADQARVWLGRLRERQRAWEPAIAAFRGVSPESDQYTAAVEAAVRCYLEWLDQLRRERQSTEALAAQAAAYCEQTITGPSGQLPAQWTSLQRDAAQWAAEIWLQYAGQQFARAERIVRAALAAPGETSAAWRESMNAWLALALAGQGRRDEAATTIAQAAAGNTSQMLALLDNLARLAAGATPEARAQLAGLSLRFIEQQPAATLEKLTPDQRRRFELNRAQAILDLGRRPDGLAAFEQLSKQLPRDAEVMSHYAQALLDGTDAANWQAALAKYRQLEQGTQPGSERWFRAKLGLALAHERLGNAARAVQIVQLTALLHPELGGPELKRQFDELLARCQRR